MGRRLARPSEFEAWRDSLLVGIADTRGDDFASEVAVVLAEEVEAFGAGEPDDRALLAVIAEARVLVQREAA